jgi:hydrogenase maturation protein HypF
LLADRTSGVSPATIAMRFHRGLAAATVAVARRFSPRPIVLGGGTFQNRLLTELIAAGLESGNQALGAPGQIPPNDGGLAAGQLAVALATLAGEGRN